MRPGGHPEKRCHNQENTMKAQGKVTCLNILIAATIFGAFAIAGSVRAESTPKEPYAARAFMPAHGDLPLSAGVPAQLANEAYVEDLARLVYYWGYPAVDVMTRTSQWQTMKEGPGTVLGVFPGGPVNTSGCLSDYMAPSQRMVVTPNNDTIYMSGLADLGREPAVIQTPATVPSEHYWTIQIADVFTNVIHQIGSAAKTPGGKYLLVGPGWNGEKPNGFIGVLRIPTNVAWVAGRSFAAHTPDSKEHSLAVLGQMRLLPLSQNTAGQQSVDCKAEAQNARFPPGLTAAMIAADPYAFRPEWVNPSTFWDDLEKILAANPSVGPADSAMADQARTLIALRKSNANYKDLLDRAALAAEASLHASSRYEQVGVDAGNGWQHQEDAGVWGSDWFGRAQAGVVYIMVNDHHEAMYFIRGTDAKGALLNGRYAYTITFPRDALPPVDRTRGGFWSLTMYDKDYFMLPDSPNGRDNIGGVSLDANELKFAPDGSLTITIAHAEPSDEAARANWLPAPDGQFALIVRAYVPTEPILDGSYKLPDVERKGVSASARTARRR
jgi:hypothetical protein